MKISHSAKHNFTRDLMLVFGVLILAVTGIVAYLSVKAKHDISQNYINDATLRAVESFQTMSTRMSDVLGRIADRGADGKLPLSDSKALNGFLFPILKSDRILCGISVADTEGENYYVADVGDGWRTSRTGDGKTGRQTLRRLYDADQGLLSEEKSPSDYDPRQRPWFLPALSANGIVWTSPYRFYDIKKVGITASLAVKADSKTARTVVAIDILLDDLFGEIQRMGPSPNSRVFVFRRDAQLYIPESGDASPGFQAIKDVEDELIKKLVASWMNDQNSHGHVFSVLHEGTTWWCGFQALEVSNRNVWMGVMVPESDIIGGISQRRTMLWSAGLLLVALSGGLVFWITRRYGRSLAASGERFDSRRPEESIRRLIAKGEGQTIEFKSTMRVNLHTGKADKKIEIAWLKAVAGFMNTDGGTLLLGVTDEGQIAGMEPDGFATEDKCRLHFKNLIKQHIGAELSKNLRFDIAQVDQKQVGVVTCKRSTEPAYLKSGKTESFYIRSGPSSEELPVSKVVPYIQNRR